MPTNKTIAVLDDHFLIAEAIQKMVEDQSGWHFYGGFSDSTLFEDAVNRLTPPTILLLDINLHNEDGLLLCKKYRTQFPVIKIIMLTGLSQTAIVKNAIKNGASGFMLKNMQRHEFWECVEKVMQGETYIHKEIEKLILNSSVSLNKTDNNYIPKLSRREKEVLQCIMNEQTTQEIANTLFITVNTVETHRASLLLKLGVKNIAGLVKVTIEKGILES